MLVSLLIVLIILLVIGALLFYAIDLAPIQQPFKNLLKCLIVLLAVVVLLYQFGPVVRLPR